MVHPVMSKITFEDLTNKIIAHNVITTFIAETSIETTDYKRLFTNYIFQLTYDNITFNFDQDKYLITFDSLNAGQLLYGKKSEFGELNYFNFLNENYINKKIRDELTNVIYLNEIKKKLEHINLVVVDFERFSKFLLSNLSTKKVKMELSDNVILEELNLTDFEHSGYSYNYKDNTYLIGFTQINITASFKFTTNSTEIVQDFIYIPDSSLKFTYKLFDWDLSKVDFISCKDKCKIPTDILKEVVTEGFSKEFEKVFDEYYSNNKM